MFFTLKSSLGPSLTINDYDSTLGLASTHWDMGIIVSADLSWSKHISKVCSSAYYFIRRNVYSSHSDVLKSLYISLVRSKLLYCSQLWSPCCLKDIIHLETIQWRTTRFLVASPHSLNYKECLIDLQLLPLMYHHNLRDVLFIVKCLLSPPDNFDILQYVSFSTHGTRSTSSDKLKVNFHRTSTTHHFYFNRVVKLWNIPSHCLDLTLPTALSSDGCMSISGITFYYISHPIHYAHSTTSVHVLPVISNNYVVS